jgi:hypothetical protein
MEYIPYKNLAPTTSFEHLVEPRGTFGSRSIVEVPWCSPPLTLDRGLSQRATAGAKLEEEGLCVA